MGNSSQEGWTVGRYLVSRLHEIGVRHVFGVPGDYVLGFMDDIVESSIELIGTCNELNAGYAADAYARINGVGAICVTYAVGGFSVLNAVAGAYAERVPVITICGGPNQRDRDQRRLLHHTLGDYDVQVEVFEHVTEMSVLLADPKTAPDLIDEAYRQAVRTRRPVFPRAAQRRRGDDLPGSGSRGLGRPRCERSGCLARSGSGDGSDVMRSGATRDPGRRRGASLRLA